MIKSYSMFFESRVLYCSETIKELCNLDKQDIEFIFQDFLDDHPTVYLQIDSVPVFNTEYNPLMITLYSEKGYPKDHISDLYPLYFIDSPELTQIKDRLCDHNLKIRDCRIVHLNSYRAHRRFYDNVIVIRIDKIT